MGLFSKPKPRIQKRRQTLASVPAMHPSARLAPVDDGAIEVRLALPRGIHFFDRFRPPTVEKRHLLDEFGAFVVRQIDGRRNVNAIVDRFVEAFPMSLREAELAVVAFIYMLTQRGVLTINAAERDEEGVNATANVNADADAMDFISQERES